MLITFLSTALASCMFRPDPPRSFVSMEHLGPSSPIHVSRSWEGFSMLQMRLRAPDGSIVRWRPERMGIAHQRFLPEGRWQPGIYVLEELGWFDNEGRRSLREATENAHWFVRTSLEIHPEDPPSLPQLGAVAWNYDEFGRLSGTFDKPTGTVVAGLEVKGIGPVNRHGIWQGLVSTRLVSPGCDDTPEFVSLPPNTRVRAYVEGPGGATQVSAWYWHVDLWGWIRGREVEPPSSWVEMVELPSRAFPMGTAPSECPSLVASEPIPRASEGFVLADQFGAFHRVREDGGGTSIDRTRYAVARPTFLHVQPDGTLLVGNNDGLHGPDGMLVAKPGRTDLLAFQHEPLAVVWVDAEGRRWQQLVDDNGVPTEPVEVVGHLPHERAIPWRQGHLIQNRDGVAYERNGVRTATLRGGGTLGLVEGDPVLRDAENGRFTDTSLHCGTEGGGVPLRYRPLGDPSGHLEINPSGG